MTPSAAPDHLRADARRNHERIVAAAAEVFAEQGSAAGVAEIARRAGVGPATLFRRFPTKQDLLRAVVETRMEEFVALATRCAQAEDPAAGLADLFESGVELHLADRALTESIQEFVGEPVMGEIRDRFLLEAERLLDRCRAAGAIREDAGPIDVAFLMHGIAQTVAPLARVFPDAHRRFVAVILAGLRPDGTPLPARMPTIEEIQAAKQGSC